MAKREIKTHPGHLGKGPVTADTPLNPLEEKFIAEYIKCGIASEAVRQIGFTELSQTAATTKGSRLLNQPNIKARLDEVMEELREKTTATAEEVMAYFTKVMRGEVKDQFGLDAPLSERTRAAQELAKRTIDLENRKKGEPDTLVSVKLDWGREE